MGEVIQLSYAREHARIKAKVIEAYKNEMFDWCDHDLACHLVANKLSIEERIVRNVVAKAKIF